MKRQGKYAADEGILQKSIRPNKWIGSRQSTWKRIQNKDSESVNSLIERPEVPKKSRRNKLQVTISPSLLMTLGSTWNQLFSNLELTNAFFLWKCFSEAMLVELSICFGICLSSNLFHLRPTSFLFSNLGLKMAQQTKPGMTHFVPFYRKNAVVEEGTGQIPSSLSFEVSLLSESFSSVQFSSIQFSSVQSLSHVRIFATPWITARQASQSITNTRSSLRLMSIESAMPSSHLILCHPLLLLPPIPPSIRVFSNESTLRMRWPKYWSFSFSIIPSKEIPGLISFRMDWFGRLIKLDLLY